MEGAVGDGCGGAQREEDKEESIDDSEREVGPVDRGGFGGEEEKGSVEVGER